MTNENHEKELRKLEERISRIPLLRDYYCSVVLWLCGNEPTPRLLLYILAGHIIVLICIAVLLILYLI